MTAERPAYRLPNDCKRLCVSHPPYPPWCDTGCTHSPEGASGTPVTPRQSQHDRPDSPARSSSSPCDRSQGSMASVR